MRDALSCEEMKNMLSNGGQLIDVRSINEFNQGALNGAINIPIDTIHFHTNSIQKDTPVLLYCRTGMRSGKVKQFLQSLGFDDVYNLGGYQHYINCQPAI